VPRPSSSRLFISWSGRRSLVFAEKLRDLLRAVNPAWDPWISGDIGGGQFWAPELRRGLAECRCALLCLTRENLAEPWVMYEAGAYALDEPKGRQREPRRSIPLLVERGLLTEHLPRALQELQAIPMDLGSPAGAPGVPPSLADLVRSVCLVHKRSYSARDARALERAWSACGPPLAEAWRAIEPWPASVHEPVYVGAFTDVYDDIRAVVERADFSGHVLLFNLELVSLRQPELWEYLFQCDRIATVKLAIARGVYMRLESRLRQGRIGEVFAQGATKLEIYPIYVEPKDRGHAFGYFQRDPGGVSPGDFVYRLMKGGPDAEQVSDASGGTPGFRTFLRLGMDEPSRQELVGRPLVKCFADHVDGIEPLSMDDVLELAKRGTRSIAEAVALQRLSADDAAELRLCEYPVDLGAARGRMDRCSYVGGKKRRLLEPYAGAAAPTPHDADCLWVPPWGLQRWSLFTGDLDRMLSSRFDVWHLTLSARPKEYTLTCAQTDVLAAILQLRQARDPRRPLVIVACSVSAYAAACAVHDACEAGIEDIAGLVLIAPAIDMFDAIDAFHLVRQPDRRPSHASELFTRLLYCGKQGHVAGDLRNDLRYFGLEIGPAHLVDLCVRGRFACSLQHLRATLGDLLDPHGVPVTFAASPRDEMTSLADIDQLATELRSLGEVRMVEVPVFHDILGGEFRWEALLDDAQARRRFARDVFDIDGEPAPQAASPLRAAPGGRPRVVRRRAAKPGESEGGARRPRAGDAGAAG